MTRLLREGRRRGRWSGAPVVVATALLAGCGDGADPPSPAAATTATVGTTTAAGPAPLPRIRTTRVDVGGRSLALSCSGRGSPTVVLDHGLGSRADDWGSMLLDVAEDPATGEPTFTQVCAYDRAGQGESDPAPGPRTGEDLASDLDRLLTGANIARPVVLVGHSIAGLHLRLFAARHPRDVAGLVLVDPSHPDQVRRERRLLPPPSARDGPVLREVRAQIAAWDQPGRTDNPEGLDLATTARQVRATGRLGDTPLLVLTAGMNPPPGWSRGELTDGQEAAFQRDWQALHRSLAALSANGAQVVVPLARHAIWIDRRDVVRDAIQAAVGVARDGGRVEDVAPDP